MMKKVLPEDAQALLTADARAVYLDVRSTGEFAAGHPAGALNLPISEPDASGRMAPNTRFAEIATALFAHDTPILCGCQAGARSARAAQLLIQAGFSNVSNVLGGYGGGPNPDTGEPVLGWRTCGLPVSTDTAQGYAALLARVAAK